MVARLDAVFSTVDFSVSEQHNQKPVSRDSMNGYGENQSNELAGERPFEYFFSAVIVRQDRFIFRLCWQK